MLLDTLKYILIFCITTLSTRAYSPAIIHATRSLSLKTFGKAILTKRNFNSSPILEGCDDDTNELAQQLDLIKKTYKLEQLQDELICAQKNAKLTSVIGPFCSLITIPALAAHLDSIPLAILSVPLLFWLYDYGAQREQARMSISKINLNIKYLQAEISFLEELHGRPWKK